MGIEPLIAALFLWPVIGALSAPPILLYQYLARGGRPELVRLWLVVVAAAPLPSLVASIGPSADCACGSIVAIEMLVAGTVWSAVAAWAIVGVGSLMLHGPFRYPADGGA